MLGAAVVGALSCREVPTHPIGDGVKEPYVDTSVSLLTPVPDTSFALGLSVRIVSRRYDVNALVVTADAGTPQATVAQWESSNSNPVNTATFDFPALANGVHHLRVVAPGGAPILVALQFQTLVGSRAYMVTTLPAPGGATEDADALAINASGDAAGWTVAGSQRAVVWRSGHPQTLDDTSTVRTSADVITASGDVLVNAYASSSCTRSSVWSANGSVRLVQAGACGTKAVGVTGDGSVLRAGAVGSALLYQEQSGILVRPSDDTVSLYLIANDVNDGGVAVGFWPFFYSGTVIHEAGYCNTAVVSLACQPYSGSTGGVQLALDVTRQFVHAPSEWVAINDRNQAIGYGDRSRTLANPTGDYIDLTPAFTASGTLIDINGGPDVLGSLAGTPYLWRAGRTYAIKPADPAWTVDRVHAMNDAGQIVGHGVNSGTGYRGAVLLTPVP